MATNCASKIFFSAFFKKYFFQNKLFLKIFLKLFFSQKSQKSQKCIFEKKWKKRFSRSNIYSQLKTASRMQKSDFPSPRPLIACLKALLHWFANFKSILHKMIKNENKFHFFQKWHFRAKNNFFEIAKIISEIPSFLKKF